MRVKIVERDRRKRGFIFKFMRRLCERRLMILTNMQCGVNVVELGLHSLLIGASESPVCKLMHTGQPPLVP